LKTPDKNGDMFQAPSRRDYVSPFEPDGQPRGAAPTRGIRWAAPTRRHCVPAFAAPKGRPGIARGKSRGTRDAAPARLRVPVRMTREGAGSELEEMAKNGDMFQAPPRERAPPSVHSVHSVHHKIKNAGETPALQEETCRAGEISGDAVILIRCGVVIAVWG